MRILLTGRSGQVGHELLPRLASLGEVFAFDRSQLDLAREDSIRDAVRSVQPTVIVNAAAYTAVDRAESEPEAAMKINATAPAILAREAKQARAVFVHYSTDYVFDGKASSPYVETDPVAPLNVYGRSKAAGEREIAAIRGAYFVLRTSWVYASRGSNFLLKMLDIGSQRESLRVVNDQIGSPTSASVVADATMAILQRCGSDLDYAEQRAGIYHVTCSGQTSWFEFAGAIFSEAQRIGIPGLKVKQVFPVSSQEFPSACTRPLYSVLCSKKLADVFSFHCPEWRRELTRVLPDVVGR